MNSRIVGWSKSPAGVLAGTVFLSFVVTVVAALAANLSLQLWHTHGNTGHVARMLSRELPLFLLSSFVVWLVVALLVAVLGRLWLSVGIIAVVTGVIGFAGQRKRDLLSEPLYPSDLAQQFDLGFISEMVGFRVLLLALLASALVIGGAVALGRRLGRRFPRPDREAQPVLAWSLLAGRALVALAAVASLTYVMQFHTPGNNVKAAFDRLGAHWRPWHQSRNYTDNGVVAGLLYNLPVPAMAAPPGYSEATMRRLVKKYTLAAATLNETRDSQALDDVNVVLVLSEAFSDPTRFKPVRLAEDPIPFTRQLMRETVSGNLLTQKYGGGTANTEFEVLTGMSTSQFRAQLTTPFQMLVPHFTEFPSAVRFFEDQGLSTAALHSYTSTLYRRAEVYDIFGFGDVTFEQDMRHRDIIGRTSFVSDEATFAEVRDILRESDKPAFVNVVTMQNHYPSAGRYTDPIPSTGMRDRHDRANLEHYARGLTHSDAALEDFLEDLRASGEKTVVAFYGDHLPAIWNHSKMPPRMKHETPFFVHANFGESYAESRPTTSPVFLLNHALEAAGAPVSPFYALLDKLEQEVPAMSHQYYVTPENLQVPWIYLPKAAQELLDDYRMVMYDVTVGGRYSEQAMFTVPEGSRSR
ncbi:MAG TPA: LTA synthase family protein [Nocardioidaceae bacterium]|nr:LTA synthase family protein [Nocardioidaceae bacterium]